MGETRRRGTRVSHVGEYEYRELTFGRADSRSAVRQALTEQAEYGHWEMSRLRLYQGGVRKVLLRRRIIRVRRTA